MKKSRFTDEQIIGFIKQAEAGMAVRSWRASTASVTPRSTCGAPFGGMEARTPSACASSSPRTAGSRRLLAEAMLDNEALKVVARGKTLSPAGAARGDRRDAGSHTDLRAPGLQPAGAGARRAAATAPEDAATTACSSG